MLEISKLAGRLHIVAQARSAGGNGVFKHFADGQSQFFCLAAAQATRLAQWRNPSAEEGFRDINIAKSGNNALVQQRIFYRRVLASQSLGQIFAAEAVAQGLWAKPLQQFVIIQPVGRDQVHHAKAPCVIKNDLDTVIGHENNVIVLAIAGRAISADEEPPGHAQMHHQGKAALTMGQDIFCPPRQFFNPLSGQAFGKILRKREPQIRAPGDHPGEPPSFKGTGKAAADGFDFGKFWHDRPRVALAPALGYHSSMTVDDMEKRASFGFQDVPEGDKAHLVRDVFNRVAGRYDVMNDVMSGGIHRLWKDAMIDWLAPRRHQRLLDVAGGTGDIAFRFLDQANAGARVCVADINAAMLQVGRDRAIDRGRLDGIDWCTMDAEALALPDRSVDAYTIAFGIRNVTHIEMALREAYRVLKPGGRFLCLEFSQVVVPGLDRLYELYSFTLVPRLGRLIARDEEAYRYLVESIQRFPAQAAFADMIRAAGFGQVKWRNLSGGIAALHSAWRI